MYLINTSSNELCGGMGWGVCVFFSRALNWKCSYHMKSEFWHPLSTAVHLLARHTDLFFLFNPLVVPDASPVYLKVKGNLWCLTKVASGQTSSALVQITVKKRIHTCMRVLFCYMGLVYMVCFLFKRKKNHPASSDSELFSSDCLYIPALCSFTGSGSAKIFLIFHVIVVVPEQVPAVLMVPPPCSHSLPLPSIYKQGDSN